ncbi:cytochrome c peroxidase [Dyadobacter jejuensis]|uniref:Cytochrome c peroxidase n=1 Tax=Dyadobacter jejuensis TaxID=1082580 RepID=A0A316AS23_9BACT|nr:cytochrome c peroxidase [Dyadobacter jejuensis]PWJ60493.1 cytochrome c peroxidase [Dyadobacter jejuensis]
MTDMLYKNTDHFPPTNTAALPAQGNPDATWPLVYRPEAYKMGTLYLKSAILIVAMLVFGCSQKEVDPEPGPYSFQLPAHFPPPVFNTDNPMSREGIELGRMLFYDVRLSGNNEVSCASCHTPSLAFSDGVQFSSAGVAGSALSRHSPALFNLAWANNGLFWDGGATNLESQVFGPLTAHDEMAQNLYELIDELNVEPSYVAAFREAFAEPINSQNVGKALAQFQRSLVSADARYDHYRLHKSAGVLTAEELAGMELVRQKCQGCHSGALFTDQGYHNNGLDADFSDSSHEGLYQGRYRISYREADMGKFKTPSLRNVALTAPYMHDGRLASLEDVLEHYSRGIKASTTLDVLIPATGMNLTGQQKKKIIAFLHTLTDHNFVNNPTHQPPANL